MAKTHVIRQGTDAEVSSLIIGGTPILATSIVLGVGEVADLNGEKLVIDADTDTYLQQTGGAAGTDDSFGIVVAGAEDFRVTANTLTALSGSTIATNTIAETTAGSGVTIDGALIKDGLTDAGNVVQALTASGAISIRSGLVTLAHATVIIAATKAAPTAGDELIIVNTSASGTVAHTVTLSGGATWDGTNNTATFDAPEEALHVVAVSATRFKILENIGSVALSNV